MRQAFRLLLTGSRTWHDVQTVELYPVLFFMQYAPVRPESVTPIELTSWVHVKPSGHVQ